MTIQPSTRPLEAISNANLLLSMIVRDESWRVQVKTELEQIAKFLVEGNSRLMVISDPPVRAHIQQLVNDLTNAQSRLSSALISELDQLDAWTTTPIEAPSRPTPLAPPPIPPAKTPTHWIVPLALSFGGVILCVGVFFFALTRQNQTQLPQSRVKTVSVARPVAMTAPVQPATTGVRLLVTNVYDPCTTGTLYKPTPNERPVGIEVALFNDTSIDVVDSSAAYFSLMGSDGLPYEARYFWCDRTIESSRLGIGQSIRGVLGFQVPVGVTPKSIRLNDVRSSSFIEAGFN